MRRPTTSPVGGRTKAVTRRIALPDGLGRARIARVRVDETARPTVTESADPEDRRPTAPRLRDRLRD